MWDLYDVIPNTEGVRAPGEWKPVGDLDFSLIISLQILSLQCVMASTLFGKCIQ